MLATVTVFKDIMTSKLRYNVNIAWSLADYKISLLRLRRLTKSNLIWPGRGQLKGNYELIRLPK